MNLKSTGAREGFVTHLAYVVSRLGASGRHQNNTFDTKKIQRVSLDNIIKEYKLRPKRGKLFLLSWPLG